MSALTGTRTLTRLALRLDRVRLPAWVLIIGLLPAGTAAQYLKLYPTRESLAQVAGVVSNRSLVVLNGPLFVGGSIGGLTAWKILVTELILVGLMSIVTVVRHSRAEEESGRVELLGAGVLGRYAPLTAALLTAGLASAAAGLLAALGLLGAKQPAPGALAMGTAVMVTGLVFAAVAGAAAQLTQSARAAIAVSVAVLGGAYLLRAVGDTGPTWLSWISPIGWSMRLRPFAHEQWWLPALSLGLAALLTAVGYALAGRRDLGFGLLPQRPGPVRAAPSLRGGFSLARRLQRGILLCWIAGMACWGAVLGGAAAGIGHADISNSHVAEVLARMGGRTDIMDAYFAAVLGVTGLVAAAYATQAALRMRTEETAGRLEPVLATATGRIRWALGHLVFAVAGSALLLAVAGLAGGLAYGSVIHDLGGQVPRLVVGAMAQAPAAWVIAGTGAALFGLAPRLSGLAWAVLVACLLVLEVGEVLGLDQWVLDMSPFAHVPKLPGATFTAAPLVWLTVVAVVLGAAGMAGFRHRDAG